MRCQNMLPTARVQPPGPPPCCHHCLTLMSWEVDLASRTERWVCSRCPFAHMARPLALDPLLLLLPRAHLLPLARPKHDFPRLARPSATTGETEPADAPPPVATHAAELGGVVRYAEAEPPSLPFAASTNIPPCISRSCLMLRACSQLAHGVPGTHIPEWWPTAVTTLLARPFLPVPELVHAVEHVSRQAFQPSSLRRSPSLRRFREWAALRHGQVTSLAELVRAISDRRDGHYLAAPLQEALLTVLLGTSAASTLERLVDSLRRAPAAPAHVANTASAEATNPTTGVHPRDDAPAGADPQATAATSKAGPSAQPPPDVHSPRLALSQAEDEQRSGLRKP